MSSKYPSGISRGPSGDWKIRATAKSSRTGKIGEKKGTLPASASLKDAVLKHDELVGLIRSGGKLPAGEWTVMKYVEGSWWPRVKKDLGSETTRERYEEHLYNHILPHFGDWLVKAVDKMAIEAWKVIPRNKHELHGQLPGRQQREPEPYSNATINSWWRVLKHMLRDAVMDLGLPRDPTIGVSPLKDEIDPDELGDETVNTLNSEEAAALLVACRREFPQWFAFVLLGFMTGCRPGELRPIRWDKDLEASGKLIIRRSQRRRQLGPTKTKKPRTFLLPNEVMEVLREHRAWLKRNGHPLAEGELVFPPAGRHWRAARKSRWAEVPEAATNKFHTASSLDKPLRRMAALAGITRPISPKVFRRSFNDIARKEVGMNNLLIRAQTGHSSIEMQEIYSTVDLAEKQAGLAKVIDLFQAQAKVQVKVQVGGLFGALPDHLRKRQTKANG